jgi:hypothetical protein
MDFVIIYVYFKYFSVVLLYCFCVVFVYYCCTYLYILYLYDLVHILLLPLQTYGSMECMCVCILINLI